MMRCNRFAFRYFGTAVLFSLLFPLGLAPVEAQEERDEQRPFAATLLFEFHSDPEVNLHHFLYRWARKQAMDAGTVRKWYPPPTLREVDTAVVDSFSEEEKALWESVLAHYREQAGRSLLFDDGLKALRDVLAEIRQQEELTAVDRETLQHLEAVLPLYRHHWWPRHDQENREWVVAVIADTIRYERQISARIAAAYGAHWPSPPNRVDLVPYASNTAAYTTGEPHTAIAAVDEESGMPWALELLFHEASHSNALEGRLHPMIEAAFAELESEVPRNLLWHILLFSISGRATEAVLEKAGREYAPYSEKFGVFSRGESSQRAWAAIDKLWYPAMDAGRTLESVLPAIARELSSPPAVEER